jgi:tetratricopeptide (TPR) repeat protein
VTNRLAPPASPPLACTLETQAPRLQTHPRPLLTASIPTRKVSKHHRRIRPRRLPPKPTANQTAEGAPGTGRDYLTGLLANRLGQINRSVQLLKRALLNLQKAPAPRASEALNTLADNYTKLGNYAEAAKAYDRLFALFPNENKGGTRDDAGVVQAPGTGGPAE